MMQVNPPIDVHDLEQDVQPDPQAVRPATRSCLHHEGGSRGEHLSVLDAALLEAGELSELRAAQWWAHLRTCRVCRQRYALYAAAGRPAATTEAHQWLAWLRLRRHDGRGAVSLGVLGFGLAAAASAAAMALAMLSAGDTLEHRDTHLYATATVNSVAHGHEPDDDLVGEGEGETSGSAPNEGEEAL